jgi:2-dehydropantoate 2-reductase
MKVAVIGPGALGCYFTCRLARAGLQTCLVDYRVDRAGRLQQSGITVETPEGTLTEHPHVHQTTPPGQDLVIVLVKSYSTTGLVLPRGVPVLTLQNGLGNVEKLCGTVGAENVLVGTTTEACTLLEEGRVRHVGVGATRVGNWTSCPMGPAVEALRTAGLAVETSQSPAQMLWEKTAIAAGIAPLTALLNVANGRLVEMTEVRQLLRDLVVEATKVAAMEGHRFDRSLVEWAEEVCRQTAENTSSMLQDVRAGKRTEIDAISGEIVRRAQLTAVPVPRTRMVWQLVRGLEQR